MKKLIQDILNNWLEDEGDGFSGVFSASGADGIIEQHAYGSRNIAENLPNTVDTSFAIASGTKLFTGLAVCKLIDENKLTLESKLCDLLPYDLGQIDKSITVFHLLTHTSGVGDYIDEEAEDNETQLQALYDKYPSYLWTKLEYYLQMITPLPPKFEPGQRYAYSNSGYVLLGLVVEAVSGLSYQQFVRDKIIVPCKLVHTGFYRMDALPSNTALGYIMGDTGQWRTNTFSVPILGGSDGGLFTCAGDLDKLWRAIFANELLSEKMTQNFLAMQVDIDEECGESYGLGVYRNIQDDNVAYYAVGVDSGVNFFTMYFPQSKIVVSSLSNTDDVDIFPPLNELFEVLA
ncbi:MAG: beta-lactamase family protein [Defluviitaleaceae bacterium]|nr:beta-lactamase family protein [Defluviitaleaceae bacterium]